jgi:hypothetical protein
MDLKLLNDILPSKTLLTVSNRTLYTRAGSSEGKRMDAGFWTLCCQSCNATFTIELTGTQQITDVARDHICPSCKTAPADLAGISSRTWHRIVGFQAAKESPAR